MSEHTEFLLSGLPQSPTFHSLQGIVAISSVATVAYSALVLKELGPNNAML